MSFDRGHALLIGIGTYQHAPRLDVPITIADARAVAEVLRDPRYCGYPDGQVLLLHDANATRDSILGTLDRLAARTTERDTLLLFYSGHGERGDDGQYYLTSHDTRISNRKVVGGTGISQQELLEKLRKLSAKRVLLIFNACHAGAVAPTLASAEEPFTGQRLPEQLASALLATGEGRVIITACRESQYSYIGNGPLTLFAQALVDALCGSGISSQDGYVSAFDLYTAIYTSVSRRVSSEYRAIQEPELTVLKGVGPFAVALYRGATSRGEFDTTKRPAPGTVVREVSQEESWAALQQIQSDGINFGQQNTVRVEGSVVSGSQRNVTTGGAYAEGDIDERQGVFVGGGTIYGPVVGSNSGTITTSYASTLSGSTPAVSLAQALAFVQEATAQARQREDEDLADDLDNVARSLQAALKAQGEGKTERRAAKLRDARALLQRIAARQLGMGALVQMLAGVE